MYNQIREQLAAIRASALLTLPKGWKVLEVKFEVSDNTPLPDYNVILQNPKKEHATITGNTPNEVIKAVKDMVQFLNQ